MKYSIIILIVLFGCKNVENEFLSNFTEVSISEIEQNLTNPNQINVKKKLINDKNVLNYFLIPINSIEYTYNYSPQTKNMYLTYYKCKIDDNRYLVSIIEKWGNLTDYNQYLGLYNVKEDKIESQLLIFSTNGLKKINSTYRNGEIFIESTYKNNLEHGLDLNPQADNSISVTERFKISDYFEKID
jgi:hypothetical protein